MVEYALHYEMTSQISGPCYDSDIELDPCKRFVWESHVRQKIYQGVYLRYRNFGTFVVKFIACLPLLGFSNIQKK